MKIKNLIIVCFGICYGNYVISSTCKLIIKHISKTSTKIEYIWSRVTALLTKILKTKSCYIVFTNHESWRKNWGIFMFHCLLKINLFLMYTNKDTTKMVDFAVYIRNTWDRKIIHSKNIYDKSVYNIKTLVIIWSTKVKAPPKVYIFLI